jgi:hypothetical protein
MSERWQSPLQRAERLLSVRLVRIEREIDTGAGTVEQWEAYLRTLDAFLRVRQILTAGPAAPAHRPPTAIRQ